MMIIVFDTVCNFGPSGLGRPFSSVVATPLDVAIKCDMCTSTGVATVLQYMYKHQRTFSPQNIRDPTPGPSSRPLHVLAADMKRSASDGPPHLRMCTSTGWRWFHEHATSTVSSSLYFLLAS